VFLQNLQGPDFCRIYELFFLFEKMMNRVYGPWTRCTTLVHELSSRLHETRAVCLTIYDLDQIGEWVSSDSNWDRWLSDGCLGFSCSVAVMPLPSLAGVVKLSLQGSQRDSERQKMGRRRRSSLHRGRQTW
jgi:hypothetical protein